jgi:hypothetical protein
MAFTPFTARRFRRRLSPHPPAGRSRHCLRLAGFPSAGEGPSRAGWGKRRRGPPSPVGRGLENRPDTRPLPLGEGGERSEPGEGLS